MVTSKKTVDCYLSFQVRVSVSHIKRQSATDGLSLADTKVFAPDVAVKTNSSLFQQRDILLGLFCFEMSFSILTWNLVSCRRSICIHNHSNSRLADSLLGLSISTGFLRTADNRDDKLWKRIHSSEASRKCFLSKAKRNNKRVGLREPSLCQTIPILTNRLAYNSRQFVRITPITASYHIV